MKIYYLATLSLLTAPLCYGNTNSLKSIESYNISDESPSESFNALFQAGNDFFRNEQYDSAIIYYKKALKLNPTCAHTHFNKGQAYYWSKRYKKALESYKKAIHYEPSHSRAYVQIGKLMFDLKQYESVIFPLKKALQLDPSNGESRLLLARTYSYQQLYDKALKCLKEGRTLDPKDLNMQFELANTYNTLNKLEKALALYTDLNTKAPDNPSIIYNIAFTLKKLGLVEESLAFYNRALEINPSHADAHFSRGLAYLVLGDFEKGWEGYEWRYHKPEQGSLRTFEEPRWNGEDLTGKTILLHAEQGLGDTFQFIRYAQSLKEKNATVIAAVQKPLVTLLQLCPYLDNVVSLSDENLPYFDFHAPMMSLPHIMHTRLDTIPCEIPYLFADNNLTHQWHEKLAADKNFKVGICWQGNSNYATPTLRTAVALKSLQLEEFAPICAIAGVSVYSLQKTTGTDQLNNLPDNMHIITFDEDFDQSNGRFMDTAAVIKNLDLVITVDTSTGHLVGGLGCDVWVLLPNPADWRWMINRNDTPWYPTMRLFKQPTPGDWKGLVQEVTQELKKHINKI